MGGKRCGAVAALIHGYNPKSRSQGRQDVAIGQGVEAIGVQEGEIDGAVGWPKFKRRHGPIAPSR